MNPSATLPSETAPVDEDMVEQAHPGHGIPSQDPDPAAQAQLEPAEAEREAKSTLMGGGAVAGMAAANREAPGGADTLNTDAVRLHSVVFAAVVPLEGSGRRTHRAVPHSQLVTVKGAPHGLNVSHAQAFNEALRLFLRT